MFPLGAVHGGAVADNVGDAQVVGQHGPRISQGKMHTVKNWCLSLSLSLSPSLPIRRCRSLCKQCKERVCQASKKCLPTCLGEEEAVLKNQAAKLFRRRNNSHTHNVVDRNLLFILFHQIINFMSVPYDLPTSVKWLICGGQMWGVPNWH